MSCNSLQNNYSDDVLTAFVYCCPWWIYIIFFNLYILGYYILLYPIYGVKLLYIRAIVFFLYDNMKHSHFCIFNETYLKYFSISWVNYSNFLVFTSCQEKWSIPVETTGIDEIRVGINGRQRFPTSNIPYDNYVVWPSREKDVVGCWVPHYHAHSSLMVHKVNNRLCQRPAIPYTYDSLCKN